MSSLSADSSSYGNPRGGSGKTPPPAPSAAFAKRAREMQDEPLMARYRPPALRALAQPNDRDGPTSATPTDAHIGSQLPPANYPAGFRRARAGTLPSNVQLAAQQYAAASTPTSQMPSTESFADQLQLREAAQAPMRPSLRHSTSVASSVASSALTERNSRLRSGSLTMPSSNGGLSTAFGPSLFSSNWAPSQAGQSGYPPMLEDANEDFDVHTLDYLGLDDRHTGMHRTVSRPPPPAATLSELRTQAQAAIASNLGANPSRMRATTVSHPNPYRARPVLRTPQAEEDEELYDNYGDDGYAGTPQQQQPQRGADYFGYGMSGASGPYKSSEHLGASLAAASRPRAISVGTLDEPVRLSRRATVSSVEQPVYELAQVYGGAPQQAPPPPQLAPQPRLNVNANIGLDTQMHQQQQRQQQQQVRFPPNGPQTPTGLAGPQYHLAAPNQGPLSGGRISPKAEASAGQGAQIQTPTRSLWIGNLDSSVTSEQLIHVFAPYGAIESLRLLPEKECGFVNFVDQADAIRAKEDVLNRLGGNIGMPNGQTVRIGFGKADSAPAAPGKNGSGAASKTTPTPGQGGLSGIEAQLQSTPTRALWIGSIPSTTTPATILSVFSPYGPIESARVLTHKNCGFINFERLDDAVRARKALNGRDVLGSDVGAIRIGFAKVPVKGGSDERDGADAPPSLNVQGVGDLSVGATIHALRSVKGATAVPVDQQVLGGGVENYRSNLLLSMIGNGAHNAAYVSDGTPKPAGWTPSVTEQQMIMKELSAGAPEHEAEADIAALAEFRPPTMYYTTIPLVADRPHSRRWDAAKLRELRKRMDAGLVTDEEIETIAADFIDGEIVELASDWLGNTVVQKLFERCTLQARVAMLERIAPHLAMIGIHKNGTWAAQKIIECVQTPDEVALIAANLRPYAPPLLLDQFGNYVVQCCLRFGQPANDFIFDAMVDRLWEIAQGRFGARSMRACLESPNITTSQQRRVAAAIILNSIPLATNPNGALLLTWLLDTSGFPARYALLAPRFTPHLSHLCTHKLASLTVLRIVNQKTEPAASAQIVDALFMSPQDHVLTDVLGDQVNGVTVVHKVLTSAFLNPVRRPAYIEATKRVLVELKVIATQAYRRLIEEVGLPVPNFAPGYGGSGSGATTPGGKPVGKFGPQGQLQGSLPQGYSQADQTLASFMASLQMGGQNAASGPPSLSIDPQQARQRAPGPGPTSAFSPGSDPYNPYAAANMRSPEIANSPSPRGQQQRRGPPQQQQQQMYGMQSPQYGGPPPPEMYGQPQYMYGQYGTPPPPNMSAYHA
ncbi:unnamed protein product [Peniophora sp. CBMAI 1063]|nr:unnamed protein product [Peniophora sp. CBMAI 1063]